VKNTMMKRLSEIMTSNVLSISPNQTIKEAAMMMEEHDFGAIPVMHNNELVGIVTDRDMALRCIAKGMSPDTIVSQCMTKDVVTGTPDMDVHEAAHVMAIHQIRRLPVVDGNRLMGMVAIGDLATTQIFQNEAGEALASISVHEIMH
jgi:CBS domain-containing protein